MIKFSIITVCLNPGEALPETLKTIEKQNYKNFEVIIKDGGSTDGSLKKVPEDPRFVVISEKDTGIYNAMNRAAEKASGDFLIFMNCGDSFHDESVLSEVAAKLEGLSDKKLIAYGDTYSLLSDSVASAAPVITEKVCYNGIPCHQAIFYSKKVFEERGFDESFRIRADHEHFLYFFFKGGAEFVYLNRVICNYEGGGFSESKKNKKRDKAEHAAIVKKYIPASKRFLYRARLIVTLQPVREKLAKSKTFGPAYEKIRKKLR